MKKSYNKGFMLAETLIVTTFVAGVLIFLFIQFSNLNKNYDDSYKYNTVEGIYSAKNIIDYIKSDTAALTTIGENVNYSSNLNITDCNIFSDIDYCLLLFELENIKKIYIASNYFDKTTFSNASSSIQKFINKINAESDEKYRIVVEFNDETFATLRFGD